jgi:hypothetical protein
MHRRLSALFVFLLLAGAVGLRGPWLDRSIWNLDEGSTFTMAQQVLDGDVLYRDAADNRTPLVPYLKALVFAAFGNWNAFAVHVALALMLGTGAILLWRLARRLGDETAGIGAALVFTVLSFVMLDPPDAISANTGWFLVLFSTGAFAAFAIVCRSPTFGRGIPVGFLFGLSALCKQPGLIDFGVCWVLIGLLAIETGDRRWAYFRFWLGSLLGAALPIVAFGLYFAAQGAWSDMVYYAFTFNTHLYINEVPLLERLAGMIRPFELAWTHAPAALVIGLASAIGALVASGRALFRRPCQFPILPWLILGWCASGILATGLSGRTFSHYSAQVVPALSLACGWGISRLLQWRQSGRSLILRWSIPVMLLAVLISFMVDGRQRAVRLSDKDTFASEVGELVARHSKQDERLLVWGYYPEIYFFSQRLPASRFIYTNYITGMIPWTNLDPLIDTAYAVAPNGWKQMEQDLKRRPPAVILDTGRVRGYLKYPLHDQPILWDKIKADFAQVAIRASAPYGMRIFRRLDSAPAQLQGGEAPIDPAIAISGWRTWERAEPPRILVHAPKNSTLIELYSGKVRVSALRHPLNEEVDVLFFVPPQLREGSHFFVVVSSPTGRTRSGDLDFKAYLTKLAIEKTPGPMLHLGSALIPPTSLDASTGTPGLSPTLADTWRLDTPVSLEYPCLPGLAWIDFVHGIEPAALGKSDGYDLIVEYISNEGATTRLVKQRLHPRTVGKDQAAQRIHLVLPKHTGGRLIFRFLAGDKNEPDYDWIYFGQLVGGAHGPFLRMGDNIIAPMVGVARGTEPMKSSKASYWNAHSPSRVEWNRPANLAVLNIDYGIEDSAVTDEKKHTDGIDASLSLVEDNGTEHVLFFKRLEPFSRPVERGPQVIHAEVPPAIPGRLVFRIDPGPRGDASFDWAWIGEVTGEGAGPNIEINQNRHIVAESSRVLDGSRSKRNGPAQWGAHADAELIYHRPPELSRVTFSYWLDDAATQDEKGKRRSDGVEVLAIFKPAAGPEVRLFRRYLDPFLRSMDRGHQTSTVELPPAVEGTLYFRILRGPANDASYDWAYWGPFKGEIE